MTNKNFEKVFRSYKDVQHSNHMLKGLFSDCEIDYPFMAWIIFQLFIEFQIDFEIQEFYFRIILHMINSSTLNAAKMEQEDYVNALFLL